MLQPYSKQEITLQILLCLHLVVEICARGASQSFLGWDITVRLYDRSFCPFLPDCGGTSSKKLGFASGLNSAFGTQIFQHLTLCLFFS
jgi:hypothetical protein